MDSERLRPPATAVYVAWLSSFGHARTSKAKGNSSSFTRAETEGAITGWHIPRRQSKLQRKTDPRNRNYCRWQSKLLRYCASVKRNYSVGALEAGLLRKIASISWTIKEG